MGDHRHSRRPARHAAAIALLGACLLASGCSHATSARALPSASSAGIDWRKAKAKAGDAGAPVRSIVAQATVPRVAVFAAPGAGKPERVLANPQPSGAPLVFLVEQLEQRWLKVLLPVRPNGSAGWVRAGQVRLSHHDFRIVVELGRHLITVYRGATVIDREPVGVGRTQTPTPGGLYYTMELIRPPNPGGAYGPYVYGISGFSDVLTSFNGGNGVVGIHGTNDPAGLGKDVSHGCIRMSNAGITKLARILPLGVPVRIVS